MDYNILYAHHMTYKILFVLSFNKTFDHTFEFHFFFLRKTYNMRNLHISVIYIFSCLHLNVINAFCQTYEFSYSFCNVDKYLSAYSITIL